MSPVTLIHSEQKFIVPLYHAIHKCRLFENKPILTASPYQVQSPVSLSIFWEFVSALNGHTVKITNTNFPELQLLSQEFGFKELSAQLSRFWQLLQNDMQQRIAAPFARIRSSHLSESFLFVINEAVIESDLTKATAL
jgi:hypothetical protein